MAETAPKRAAVSQPSQLLKPLVELVEGNDKFMASRPDSYFDSFQATQTPRVTLVCCSDSRVHTGLFGDVDPTNNIFAIRNIGNQVDTALGSIEYGVTQIKTSRPNILLILGHSGCGAVKAAMNASQLHALPSSIRKEVTPMLNHVQQQGQSCSDVPELWKSNVEKNVDGQVQVALHHFKSRVENGETMIVGAVYDFNGLYDVGQPQQSQGGDSKAHKRGALVVLNVNGKTSKADILKAMPTLPEHLQGHVLDRL